MQSKGLSPLTTVSAIAALSAGIAFAFLIAVAVLLDRTAVLVYLRDPAAHYKYSPYSGVVSYLGVLATVSSAAVCLFASVHARSESALLRVIGLFGLLIGLDDLFLLHEDLFPKRLGVPEVLAYVIYGLMAIFIGIRYRAQLTAVPIAGLMVAVVLLGSSIALDALTKFSSMETVIEDGLKFVGLVVWSVYWMMRANMAVAASTPRNV